MAKTVRLLAVLLLSGALLVPVGAAPAVAQDACTETWIYYAPFPDVQTYPIPCDSCPAGVGNWVHLGRGIVVVYTCHYR